MPWSSRSAGRCRKPRKLWPETPTVQEFHRQLFVSAGAALREAIERIVGVKVREATAEIEPNTGAVVKAFASGTVVQVFLLAHSVETDVWSNDRAGGRT